MSQYTYPFIFGKNPQEKPIDQGDISPSLGSISLQSIWDSVEKPIVEIGGPSDLGYRFLNNISLKSQPIITNISKNPAPYAAEPEVLAAMVEAVVDGRRMPYKDASIGAILMSSMSYMYDGDLDGASDEEMEKIMSKIGQEGIIARYEINRVIAGLEPFSSPIKAQRPAIYTEIRRVLAPGGLALICGEIEDVVLIKELGFDILVMAQDRIWGDSITCEVLAQKHQ